MIRPSLHSQFLSGIVYCFSTTVLYLSIRLLLVTSVIVIVIINTFHYCKTRKPCCRKVITCYRNDAACYHRILLMDSDLAWVNGKSGRQSWRFPALCNIWSHLPFYFYFRPKIWFSNPDYLERNGHSLYPEHRFLRDSGLGIVYVTSKRHSRSLKVIVCRLTADDGGWFERNGTGSWSEWEGVWPVCCTGCERCRRQTTASSSTSSSQTIPQTDDIHVYADHRGAARATIHAGASWPLIAAYSYLITI